jgi:hypothetical protein
LPPFSWQDLLPAMMQTLTVALNSGEEATAQEALEMFIEIAGTEPRFLRKQLVDVVAAMLQIAEVRRLTWNENLLQADNVYLGKKY